MPRDGASKYHGNLEFTLPSVEQACELFMKLHIRECHNALKLTPA